MTEESETRLEWKQESEDFYWFMTEDKTFYLEVEKVRDRTCGIDCVSVELGVGLPYHKNTINCFLLEANSPAFVSGDVSFVYQNLDKIKSARGLPRKVQGCLDSLIERINNQRLATNPFSH